MTPTVTPEAQWKDNTLYYIGTWTVTELANLEVTLHHFTPPTEFFIDGQQLTSQKLSILGVLLQPLRVGMPSRRSSVTSCDF